jgi:hypothetical protein
MVDSFKRSTLGLNEINGLNGMGLNGYKRCLAYLLHCFLDSAKMWRAELHWFVIVRVPSPSLPRLAIFPFVFDSFYT